MSYINKELALVSLGLGCQSTNLIEYASKLYRQQGIELKYYSCFFNWLIAEAQAIPECIIKYRSGPIPFEDFILDGNYFRLKDFRIWFWHDIFNWEKSPPENIRRHQEILRSKFNYLLQKFYALINIPKSTFLITNAQNTLRYEAKKVDFNRSITADAQEKIIKALDLIFPGQGLRQPVQHHNRIIFLGDDIERTDNVIYVKNYITDPTDWRGSSEWARLIGS